MAENSKIEWCHHTFNLAWGCVKVSDGCKNCYADTLSNRYGFDVWGVNKPRRTFGAKHWAEPLKWNKKAQQAGERHRVFCSSMTDVFFDDPTIRQEQPKLWALIEATPNLDWLLLTKRPENIMTMIPSTGRNKLPGNVWVGTSVEHQKAADERIPHLLQVPAVVRFLSCEPLLGPVDLNNIPSLPFGGLLPRFAKDDPRFYGASGRGVDWVIVGGESGHNARPMHPEWARSLRNQCQTAGVAFHYKQWGEWVAWIPNEGNPNKNQVQHVRLDGKPYKAGDYSSSLQSMIRIGKHKAGRELDGRTWDEFPAPQVQEVES